MGVISNKVPRGDLKPGDHIYSWRAAHLYSHHGIFVSDEEVIHFTRPATKTEIVVGKIVSSSKDILSSSSSRPCCSRDHSRINTVVSSCLNCFLNGGNLYRYEYNVKPAAFLAKTIGGTCTLATSDPPEVVISRARYLLRDGYGVYKLLKHNCETFALYCKTELVASKRTGQANSVGGTTWAGFGLACIGLPLVGYCAYSYGRLMSDICMRKDVDKVPVERLVAEHKDVDKVLVEELVGEHSG
ncbi:unnamed protein product [Microthlaspi erraticum]|uniref:LRAT domain-containing protein n=1 Tax=Microthlaspi erraticum TaxID=1685480 RepID=A0A6D2JCQ7_9BRAS|nr:unnamed protein product [Microthlaspi erraticum]